MAIKNSKTVDQCTIHVGMDKAFTGSSGKSRAPRPPRPPRKGVWAPKPKDTPTAKVAITATSQNAERPRALELSASSWLPVRAPRKPSTIMMLVQVSSDSALPCNQSESAKITLKVFLEMMPAGIVSNTKTSKKAKPKKTSGGVLFLVGGFNQPL